MKVLQSDEYDEDMDLGEDEEGTPGPEEQYSELDFSDRGTSREYEPDLDSTIGQAVDLAVAEEELAELAEQLELEDQKDKQLIEEVNSMLDELLSTRH